MVFAAIVCGSLPGLQAQELSNKRSLIVEVYRDSIVLDSLSIIPSSFLIRSGNEILDTAVYSVDFINSVLFPGKGLLYPLKIKYRVFPFSWAQKKDTLKKHETIFLMEAFSTSLKEEPQTGESQALQYSGNFSRAISFGNSQDAVLHSSMNLQLSGKLSNDIEIQAAISDNQIPLQPEGTTHNIREFDRIFVELKKNKHRLMFGDFSIQSNQGSEFLKFQKKQQGASYLFSDDRWDLSSSYSIAKGSYHEMSFDASDGNQGPYQLRGKNGELFIIVLAGSEQVFINGELMKRGEEFDYIIDYNTGEIYFTSNRFISSDLRIKVSFEYAERSYARSAINVSANYKNEKTGFFFNIYSEKDQKNNPVDIEFSESDRKLLSEKGDQKNIISGGIDTATYSKDRIFYKITDTIVDGKFYDSVFAVSSNPSKAMYLLNFIYSGNGRGDYVLSKSVTNGNVYKWIAPNQDGKAGNYRIGIVLESPNSQQMYTGGMVHEFNKHHKVESEITFSSLDDNTFSKKDDQDNLGLALKTSYSNQHEIGKSRVRSFFDYKFVNRFFKPVERFRAVEFSRNWNLSEGLDESSHETKAGVEFSEKKLYNVNYTLRSLILPLHFNGLEHNISGETGFSGIRLLTSHRLLTTAGDDQNSKYYNPLAKIAIRLNDMWYLNAGMNNEYNSINANNDNLMDGSYQFIDYSAELSREDSLSNKFNIGYHLKYENRAKDGSFQEKSNRSHHFRSSGELLNIGTNRISWSVHFSNEKVFTQVEEDISGSSANYYLGEIYHQGDLLNKSIQSTLTYNLGSGNELASQLTYIEVEEGKGTHSWIDDGDGIKEIDEFVISPFQDENDHVQLITKTNESVSVHTSGIIHSIQFNPSKFSKTESKFLNLLKKFSIQSTISSRRKIFRDPSNSIFQILNPFPNEIEDTLLFNSALTTHQQLYFNRGNSVFGFEIFRRSVWAKNLLNTGFSIHGSRQLGMIFRINPLPFMNSEIAFKEGTKGNFSDYLSTGAYNIISKSMIANLGFLWGKGIRLNIGYDHSHSKNNLENGGAKAITNQLTSGITIQDVKLGSVQLNYKLAMVDYMKQEENELLNFAMLNGLQPGLNSIWNARISRNISDWLLLTITYDGRKTGKKSRTLHTGQAKMSVIF